MNPDSPARSGSPGRRPRESASSAPTASAASKGRLRERFRAETRDAILAAAERALAEHGARGAKMEVIASTAGIAVGTLYNYFDDRQRLIDALFESRRAELLERLDQALDGSRTAPFEQQLTAFFGAGLGYFHAHREFVALALHDELSAPEGSRWSMALTLRARAERLCAHGVESGQLRAEDREMYPHVMAGLLRGLIVSALGLPPEVTVETDGTPALLRAAVRCFLVGAGQAS